VLSWRGSHCEGKEMRKRDNILTKAFPELMARKGGWQETMGE
jgi:hypothetical protein